MADRETFSYFLHTGINQFGIMIQRQKMVSLEGKDLNREPRSLRVLKFKMTGNCYDMSYEIPQQYDVGSPCFSLLLFDIYKLIQSIIARVFHAHIGPSISIRES